MPEKKSIFKKPDIKQLQAWVYEAQWAAKTWREQSWRSSELYDGGDAQWTQEDWDEAKDSGIDPLSINRTFPTTNLILGYQILNKFDIIAKGRTQKDAEISQIMTEGLKFIMDQYDGEFLVSQAFRDAVIPGFGCLGTGFSQDPRQEKLMVEGNDWKEVWWDPFGPVWWEPSRTRYVFKARWMDIESLIMLFEKKKEEIESQYQDFVGHQTRYRSYAEFQDEATFVEETIKGMGGGDWTDQQRRRVRPVELWYAMPERAVFALFRDGRYVEIKDEMPLGMMAQLVAEASEVVGATVLKMRVTSFFGDVILQDLPSPYPHDQYPLVPFIGYTDRYNFPYGIPFQIMGMQEEINKRRSMATALLRSRRVIIEKDASPDQTQAGLDTIYEEANKLNSFIVLKSGGMQKFDIQENQTLVPSQVKIMESSEQEIGEIGGPNYEMMGYESNATSGVAIEKRSKPGEVRVAPLFENLRRSMKRIGEQTIANIQGFWTGEKVLRITDRMTGAEKFVEINHRIQTETGNYEVKNNICQGKFDCIVSEAPQTDTVKEKHIELFQSIIQKSPPEIIPYLISIIFELTDLPNKEVLLSKLKPMLGVNPLEEDMSPEEVKQQVLEQMEAQKQQQAMAAEIQKKMIELDLQNKELTNKKVMVEISKLLDEQKFKRAEAVMGLRQMAMGNVLPMPQKKVGQGGASKPNGPSGNKQAQRG